MARHARTIIVLFTIAGCASESAERYWAGVMDEWRKDARYEAADALWDPHSRDPSRDINWNSQSRCDDD